MNFEALIRLICSISVAFGGLVTSEKEHENALDSCLKYKYHDFANSSLPIFKKLTPDIFLHIFEYLENPNLDLLCVCKLFNTMMVYDWMPNQKKLFRSLSINPALTRIESDAEIYHLLKINPIILDQFFDDFVFSENCLNLLCAFVKKYNLELTSNSFNRIIFEYWIDSAIYNNFASANDIVEWFRGRVSNIKKLSYVIAYNYTIIDRNHRLYKISRSILKALLGQYYDDPNPYQTSPFFRFKFDAEDLEYFFGDYEPENSVILDNIRIMACEFEKDYTTDEKLFFRTRNQDLLSKMSYNFNENEILNLEIINIIRYSEAVDNDSIMENYFTGKGSAFNDDLTESFAMAALQAKNIDLFLKMYQLRNSKKFSTKFSELIHESRNLIKIISDYALLNFFTDHFWNFKFEVLARMSIEERLSLVDLEFLFLNDKLGIFLALALFYPMETFIEHLSKSVELIPSLPYHLFSSHIKYRNNLNDPIQIVHEAVKFTHQLDPLKARTLIEKLFRTPKFVRNCIESKNWTNLADLLIIMGNQKFYLDSSFVSKLKNSRFRRSVINPLLAKLFDNLNLRSLMYEIVNVELPRDINLIVNSLGLQLGDFNFTSPLVGVDHGSSNLKINQLKGENLDKFLVEMALYELRIQEYNYLTKRNPTLLKSFLIFQLWWEKNPEAFMKFAPDKLVQDFKKRFGIL